ncbi:cytosolic carboxypeptidase 6-like [Vanessa cardui]|uniref:cytosolic carboxypeptidase 6-like n=1 Tax=Vanessa cardui TaxID=171605 RepID=UPI001F1404EA|nr:cytosolic carboxypeptidase 6-like [Vanessa cardui]
MACWIIITDSEESDGEGGLGNLNRLIVRPPGHSGKAKRGHLCFDAAFECGNLGRADHITELEYDLFIRPDTCRPRSRFWFNFTVENVKQDQRVIFNIVNLGKENNLFNEDMTPLVRSTSRPKWQRIPRRLIFYHRSLVHRGRKILSLAFGFDKEEDVYQFAAAAPYSYSRLQKHLAIWEKRAQTFATRESIAQTTQKRRIDLITIGNLIPKEESKEESVTKGKPSEARKRVVVILARVHGGEQPSSYICQGFLDYIASSSEKAIALRNGIVIQVVPMLNPDGVFLGNQRSDLLGSDLNRSWNKATSYAHPALIAVNDLLKKITAEKALQLDFIIDIHSDISHEGVFVRGNSYDDVYRFERHAVLPKFLGMRVEAWKPESCLYNADPLALGSARRSLPTGTIDAYTLLASLGGRRLTPRGPFLHYTEDAYFKIGRSLAKALCDYYRHVGVIPPREGTNIKKKESRRRRRRKRPINERERSPSSSPERRVLVARILSPPLPARSPPTLRALPLRTTRNAGLRARPRTVHVVESNLPIITGKAVRTPRLAVVDLSAYIRTPAAVCARRRTARTGAGAAGGAGGGVRAPRPTRTRARPLTSDEYDTHDSDS